MRNSVRLLFLGLIILMISGCTAEYNIDIKSDFRIEEDIKLLEDNSYLYSICPTNMNECINNNISNVRKQGIVKERFVSIIDGNEESGVDSLFVYDDFNAFQKDNILLNQFYKSMTMTTNGSTITLSFDSIDKPYPSLNVVAGDDITGTLLTNFKLNIKVPYEVVSNNADSADKINNIYTWNYTGSTLYKDVNLVFDKSKTFSTNIADVVDKNYKEGKLNDMLIIGILGGVALIVIIFFGIRNYRRNRV